MNFGVKLFTRDSRGAIPRKYIHKKNRFSEKFEPEGPLNNDRSKCL